MNKPDLPENARVHMIGITGAGMSGLAIILVEMGYIVTGSDRNPSPVADKLHEMGVTVYSGHRASNVGDADLVVASAAVPEDNPEILEARAKSIPVISRAQLLGMLMNPNVGIGVAGTHGKTTTTSMLALVLDAGGVDSTVVIGGNLAKLNGNAKLGSTDIFLAEACEAFNSFLELIPKIALITNIDADHLDCHGSLEGVKAGFLKFLAGMDDSATAVVCGDCPNVLEIIPSIRQKVVTYGINAGSDCLAYEVDSSSPEPSFKVKYFGDDLGRFRLRVPGVHNVLNALGAIAVGMELGIDADAIRHGLLEFDGAGRRFDILGVARDVMVVDDYAHHPTEVRATLLAAKSWGRRIVAVFQPHLFSRTQLMAEGFADSLNLADVVYLADIYPAREEPIPGVTSALIVDRINVGGVTKAHLSEKDVLSDELTKILEPGDILIVMGAGDIRSVAEGVLARLESQQQ